MSKVLSALCATLVLGACATGYIDDDEISAALSDAKNGIVLLHTSLHEQCRVAMTATLAPPNEAGPYISREAVPLHGAFFPEHQPSQITLPAGEYGILGVTCGGGSAAIRFFARPTKVNSSVSLFGHEWVFERPLAVFKVNAGEVVDVGSLVFLERPRVAPSFGDSGKRFATTVVPMPEAAIRALAAYKPKLLSRRVVRLMTVPSGPPDAGAPTASQTAPPLRSQPATSSAL